MINIAVEVLKRLYADKGYVLHAKPHELNLGAVRSYVRHTGFYTDTFFMFFKNRNDDWVFRQYPCSTTPTGYWMLNPMKKEGTAILKPGQYVSVYEQGLHRGKHPGFLQRGGKVNVYRDNTKDLIVDYNEESVQEGYFGINIHRSWSSSRGMEFDKTSAGCQVMEQKFLDEIIKIADVHKKKYGNKFTYTLINEEDLYMMMQCLMDGNDFENGAMSSIQNRIA